jgi:hypothetical protein
MNDHNGFIIPIAITTLFAIAVTCLIVWLMFSTAAKGADNDQPCLTKEQARAKYPGQYLYWRTAAHCWYGRSKSGRQIPTIRSRSVRHYDVKVVRWNEYNELDAAADRETYFNPGEPLPIWKLAPIPKSKFAPWDERIGM